MIVHARVVSRLKDFQPKIHKQVTDEIMKGTVVSNILSYEHLDFIIDKTLREKVIN